MFELFICVNYCNLSLVFEDEPFGLGGESGQMGCIL